MTRAVAAFDFDGTLTRRDTLVPFLRLVAGTSDWAQASLSCVRHLADRDGGRRRDNVKATMLRRVFAGRSVASVEPVAERYAAGLAHRLWPESRERVAWHAGQGHRLVLVSASLALYALPAAQALGFDDVIAVELETDDDRYTGAMDGPNVRGDQKALRLTALLGDPVGELWAYGNSAGDAAMLAMADRPHRVTRRGTIIEIGADPRATPPDSRR
ncbi:MAG: HAD-IB family hydrolase [Acidimicrobiales bacterium]